MNNFLIHTLLLFNIISFSFCQVKPNIIPLSLKENYNSFQNENKFIHNINKSIELEISSRYSIFQYLINLNEENYYFLNIEIDYFNEKDYLFIINKDTKSYIGPYFKEDFKDGTLKTDIIKGKNIIIELNNEFILEQRTLNIIINKELFDYSKIEYNNLPFSTSREEPTILVTGYWPPTNEMIRHFSMNTNLNPEGWQGDNWENRGYDIISYFPEFSDPDCSSCGQGYGDLEVDYQDTSDDFWPIFNEHSPIALITFSKGYNNQSWELEYNAYNRTNWINDFTSPFLPTPNPPDSDENILFLRNSNLPMENIIEAIEALDLGLNPYIDINGDPGHYVSEFMAYHGTWYRDLNLVGDNKCISAGHIHVGGQIDIPIAKIATEESIRTLIDYIDSMVYTSGDVNQDNVIDILDLVLIMNNILGNNTLSQIEFYASDMNEDAIINIQDIIIIINIILNNF